MTPDNGNVHATIAASATNVFSSTIAVGDIDAR
jgi:hypothetical protein